MADAGCQCVYVVDSAGAMITDQAGERVAALVAELGDDAQVGFHGHENLSLGVANSLCAIKSGAVQIDGSARRFGAGAGNTPVEALAAVCDKLGITTGIERPDSPAQVSANSVERPMSAGCGVVIVQRFRVPSESKYATSPVSFGFVSSTPATPSQEPFSR